MPLDAPSPTVGGRANRLKNTGIPPPGTPKTSRTTAPEKSKWPEIIIRNLDRTGIRQQLPQGGRTS
jgi:hypothetical protein